MGDIQKAYFAHSAVFWGDQEGVGTSKIETVMAILTQIVPSQNINAHMQTKN